MSGGQLAGGGELGGRREHARDEPRQGQFAHAPGGAVQQPRQPQLPAQPQHGGHVPVGQGALHDERLVRGAQHHAALEHAADAFDEFGRQVGEVGDGLLSDAFAFSPGFSQQDGGRAVAVGDGFDVVGQGAALHGNKMLG